MRYSIKPFNLLIYSVEIPVRKAASGGLKRIEELYKRQRTRIPQDFIKNGNSIYRGLTIQK